MQQKKNEKGQNKNVSCETKIKALNGSKFINVAKVLSFVFARIRSPARRQCISKVACWNGTYLIYGPAYVIYDLWNILYTHLEKFLCPHQSDNQEK